MQGEGFPDVQVYYNGINGGRVDQMNCSSANGGKSIETSSSSSVMESSNGVVRAQWTAEDDRYENM